MKFISGWGYIYPASYYLMFLIVLKFILVNSFEHLKYLLKMIGGGLLALSKPWHLIKRALLGKIHDISGYKPMTRDGKFIHQKVFSWHSYNLKINFQPSKAIGTDCPCQKNAKTIKIHYNST